MPRPTLNNATLLVCGGAGFIGSNFIRHVFANYPLARVVCVDALTYAGNKSNLEQIPAGSDLIFKKGNITDAQFVEKICRQYEPHYVINFAAESHVDRSIHGQARSFVETNVVGIAVLLEALAGSSQVKKFVQVSTDEVYGSLPLSSRKKFTESSPLRPNSPYASSKASADLVARSFFVTYDVPAVITRCSNNYGAYQHPEKLIPYSVLRVLRGEPVALYGDGKYVRDWIHVDDHCEALLLTLLKGKPGEIYNIGASEEISNIRLARELLRTLGKDASSVVFVEDRPGHDRRYAIDSTKISRELGWKPKRHFRESFADVIRWYVDNQRWVQEVTRSGVPNAHIKI